MLEWISANHHGNLVVDVGGGTTDIAVISIGNSVIGKSLNVAGNKFDETIMNFLKKEYKILVGERTAEDIKMKIGCVYPHVENTSMTVRGRNAENGMPISSCFELSIKEHKINNSVLSTESNFFVKNLSIICTVKNKVFSLNLNIL